MAIEPAERQEKIPTESPKKKEREGDCKRNERVLQLGRRLLQRGGKRHEGRKRREYRSGEQLTGREGKKVLQ